MNKPTFREMLYHEYCKPKNMLTLDLAKKLKLDLSHITKATHDNVLTDELEQALAKHFKTTKKYWRNLFNNCAKVEEKVYVPNFL